MTQAILCLVIAMAFLALMPAMVRWSRRSRRGRGAGAGIGDALLSAYDPARKVAIDQIRRQQEIGDHESGVASDKLD